MSAFSTADSIVSAPDSPAMTYYQEPEHHRIDVNRTNGTTRSHILRPTRSTYLKECHPQPYYSNSSSMMEAGSDISPRTLELLWDRPKRSKRAATVRIVRRIVGKEDRIHLDESTVPKLKQKDIIRAERKKLAQLDEYQRTVVMRQLAEKEQEKQFLQPRAETRKSVKKTLKNVIDKTTQKSKKRKAKKCENCQHGLKDDQLEKESVSKLSPEHHVQHVPEHMPLINNTRDFIAELPNNEANSAETTVSDIDDSIVKRPLLEQHEEAIIPAYVPLRVVSPVSRASSAPPRRALAPSHTRTTSSSKQMQCDECHEPIRLTQTYYSCSDCDSDDKIYCFRCADEGRTCRHSLDMKTRNIRRVATNPENDERRSQSSQSVPAVDATLGSAEAPINDALSSGPVASSPLQSLPLQATAFATISPIQQHDPIEPSSPVSPVSAPGNVLEFNNVSLSLAKRREQEIAYRKELNFVNSQALLIQKETAQAWMQQQYCAAAFRQQQEKAAGIGSQFTVSGSGTQQNTAVKTEDSVSRQSSSASANSGINLESPTTCKSSFNVELASAVAGYAASANGMSRTRSKVRSRGYNDGNASTRDAPRTYLSHSPPVRKFSGNRTGRGRESEDNDDDDEDQEGRSFKRQKSDSSEPPSKKLFACPYSKFQPSRYSLMNSEEIHYRGCTGVICRDISRVKQHLKRKHHKPDYYCRRCFREFKTEDHLNAHSAEDKPCIVKRCPWPEKLDEAKQKAIHTKKPGMDAEKQWYDIFSVIFPGAPRPSTPYVEAPTTPQAGMDSVDMVLQVFEEKLNEQSQMPGCEWLQQETFRAIIRQAAFETQTAVRSRASPLPTLFVSPVSPPSEQGRWEDQHSSPVSSPPRPRSSHKRQRSLQVPSPGRSPTGAKTKAQLKSALRVRTSGNGISSDQSSAEPSSSNSAQSGILPFNVNLQPHVAHDPGWEGGSGSWGPGDDTYIMNNRSQKTKEPCSATSSGSRKSVTFKTPPQQPMQDEAEWREGEPKQYKIAPSLADSGYDTTSIPRSESDYPQHTPDQFSNTISGIGYPPSTIDPKVLSNPVLSPGYAAMGAVIPNMNIDPSFPFNTQFFPFWPAAMQLDTDQSFQQIPPQTFNFQQQQQQQQHRHNMSMQARQSQQPPVSPLPQSQTADMNYDNNMFGRQ